MAMYCIITSSVTMPDNAAQYPRPHRWRPKNSFDKRRYSLNNFLDVFPLIRPITLLMDSWGGTETNR